MAPPLVAVLACLLLAPGAGAADKFRYHISITPATYNGTPSGDVTAYGLDTAKTTTIRLLRASVPQYTASFAAGPDSQYLPAGTLQPGDQIEVQQPTGTVLETYTVPQVSLTGTPGSPVVTGHGPDGSIAIAQYQGVCSGTFNDDFQSTAQGGAFSMTFPKPLVPGSNLRLIDLPGKGDRITYTDRVPGETPCLFASAFRYPDGIGATPTATPYELRASSFRGTVATGARIVLRRAGAALVDYSAPSVTDNIYTYTGIQPLPGDTIELYRPHTAPSPSATFTIPAASGVYDASTSLVAVDAPAASQVEAFVGSIYTMYSNARAVINPPAGRTFLNFAAPDGFQSAIDLTTADYIFGGWVSPDSLHEFDFGLPRGDLTAPVLKLKLASKFKISKLGRSVPVVVTSTEIASAGLQLTLPAKLKTSASKKPKKPTVVASAKGPLKAGSTKFKLKLTKAGKKVLKRIRKSGLPAQTATLTVTATDPSGNVSTKTKTTKLARK